MTRIRNWGITAQKLTSLFMRHAKASRGVQSIEVINQGADKGREWSFEVRSGDGAVYIVTVHQERMAESASPEPPPKSRVFSVVDARQAKIQEEQRRAVAAREAARRRFLGENV